VLVVARPGLTPNFEIDPIAAVYFVIHNECADLEQSKDYTKINGAIFNKSESLYTDNAHSGPYHGLTYVKYAKNEINLLNLVVELFRTFDPDIIVGYETET
jgi:DNA polymerase elongation subunit (family B)